MITCLTSRVKTWSLNTNGMPTQQLLFNLLFFLAILFVMGATACHSQENQSQPIVPKEELPTSDTIPNAEIAPLPFKPTIDLVIGHFDPAQDTNFALIQNPHTNRQGIYLRKEAYAAFINMYEAAKKDNITLVILSATRNFTYQKRIWESKWKGLRLVDGQNLSQSIKNHMLRAKKILEYSSMPGTSRHHWGTDIDLNNLNNDYFEKGQGLKVYQWLQNHAHEFGFCQTYTKKDASRPHGYFEEKWHWSYLPIAEPLTKFAQENLTNEDIKGFDGAQTAIQIDVVNRYILGINPTCLSN